MSIFFLQDINTPFLYIRSSIERGDHMSAIIQYDLFEPKPTEVEVCQLQIEAVNASLTKVRRGTYASIGELKKENYELKCRLEILERHICKGKSNES